MAINFCCSYLKTKVHSPAVSCEGYELSNLLSTDPLNREKGFLSEYFVKPPVSIFLEFFCYVNISHILIWTEVGRQKSDGLEVYVKNGTTEAKGESSNSSHGVSAETKVKIGSCRLKNESGLMLRKYINRVEPVTPPNFQVKHFISSSRFAIQNARCVEIKIYSTANSSIPALKRIEIWGNPSRSCSKELSEKVLDLWRLANTVVESLSPDVEVVDEKVEEKVESKPLHSENENSVPDEFVDPITCEIMAIPMTLPSGKVIDLSTLEKFNDVESTWGRAPCDPFTGISFTKTRFAIPDAALKSRIDQYLVENGHLKQLKGVGRTVGRAKSSHPNLLAKLSEVKEQAGEIPRLESSTSEKQTVSSLLKAGISSHSSSISKDDGEEIPSKSDGCDNNSFSDQNRTNMKRKKCEQVTDSLKKLKTSGSTLSVKDHEEMLEDTLDSAIGSVLNGLPSFVKSVLPNVSKDNYNERKDCGECHSLSCLFSLPCKHLVCRSCLVKKSSQKQEKMICVTCKSNFSSGDVSRFHNA